MPKLVRLALTHRQAEALAQLADEADPDTFKSTTETEAEAEAWCRAGRAALEKLHDAISHFEQKTNHRFA